MRKSISILLVLAVMLGLCACGGKKGEAPAENSVPADSAPEQNAAAADEPAAAEPVQEESAAVPTNWTAPPAEEAYAVPACGFQYVYPEEYRNADGVIRMMEQGRTRDSVALELVYILVPKEEHEAFLEFEKSLGEEGLTLPALYEKGYRDAEKIKAFLQV